MEHNNQNQESEANNMNPHEMSSESTKSTDTPVPVDNNLLMGVLCYLGILIIIPYLMAKDNPFVKFHIKQGLVLVVIELVVYAIGMTGMMYSMLPVVGLINLACLVLSIIGIVNVVQKKESALPLVGGFADKIHI